MKKDDLLKELISLIKKTTDLDEKVSLINELKKTIHKHSPFKKEPVDCVVWVKADNIEANDYNPNAVAPTEMKLLEHSIREDGYTQPVVSWEKEDSFEVVDGFHRTRVGKESKVVSKRINGYLPLVVINSSRTKKQDRIASTIRHNRARGKHKVDAMSEIVVDLKKRNWSDKKIANELGMDADEVLRLAQISGLAEMFSDKEFSKSWIVDSINESDSLTDNVEVSQ